MLLQTVNFTGYRLIRRTLPERPQVGMLDRVKDGSPNGPACVQNTHTLSLTLH